MASAASMKPNRGAGATQNAKAQPAQRQGYGKGKAAAKNPPKPPGKSGDKPSPRKGSPFAKKK